MKKLLILALVSVASISNISYAIVRGAGVGGVGMGVRRGVVGRPVARGAIASQYSNGRYTTQNGATRNYPTTGTQSMGRGTFVRGVR
jgi:hypothetical protein